jgi:ABC-type nitrate/sulfonate/bicarbonate transport system ATPase subunit
MVETRHAKREGKITLRQVSKIFNAHQGGSIHALLPTDLDIEPGEFVCIIGPSGCGKSTLLRLVAGLEKPTTGVLAVDGVPIKRPEYTRGFVSQDPFLFPWKTVWHNVATGLEARKLLKGREALVDEFLKLVGLQDFAQLYPHQLSGGMAQRASLARSLINQPAVLLLDEPLGALDALTRITMQDEILRIWKEVGTTMLFVTHDIDEALYLSDRTLVLTPSPGQIKEIIKVDLPRPRHRETQEFFQYRRLLLSLLGIDDHGPHLPIKRPF